MKITTNMKIRSRQLCILAKQLEWGSERQIEAEDELCELAQRIHDDQIDTDNQCFEDIVFRMTTNERVDFALAVVEGRV